MSLWSTHGEINLDSTEICGDRDAASATAAIASSELGPRLKILGMSGCSLSAVPTALSSLHGLEALGLNVNRITELPIALAQVPTEALKPAESPCALLRSTPPAPLRLLPAPCGRLL